MPKVSIIVPVFNCEAYIEECLRSVMGQSERDLEIIVVDDGSTDGTPALVKKAASLDPRVLIYSQANSGYAGVARNAGLAQATGRYIGFLDADDQYHVDRIKKSVSVLEAHPEIDIVFHDHKSFHERPERDETASFLDQTRFVSRAAGYLQKVEGSLYTCRTDFYVFASLEFVPFHTSSIMFRREILPPNGPWFREDVYPGEDGDLWLRLTRDRRVAFLNEVLSYYRQWPGGITRDRSRYLRTSIQIHSDNLMRGMDIFDERQVQRYRSRIAQQFFELGYCQFYNNKLRDARIAYRRSMALDFHAEALGAYLKTLIPQTVVQKYRAWAGREASG